MRFFAQTLSVTLVLTLGFPLQAFSGDRDGGGRSVGKAIQASGRVSTSAANLIAETGKVVPVSGAAPMPLLMGGAVLGSAGAASTGGAVHGSDNAVTANNMAAIPVGSPLDVSDEALVAALPTTPPAVEPGTAATRGFSSASSMAGEQAHFLPEQIIKFAKKVEKTMAAKGARVAILARMGRPRAELPEGMHFTHVAFAVYSEITTGDHRSFPGYAIYNLYQRNNEPNVSDLVQDFPVDFFGGVAELEAGIIIPSAELQKRLLDVISSPTYAQLHDQHYSVIANPYSLGRQNCTEFVLDVTNSALYQSSDIKKIKAIEIANFDAQKVNVGPLKLMLGAMFTKEVSTSDHNGAPVTATFETIGDYLKRYDAGSDVMTVLPEI